MGTKPSPNKQTIGNASSEQAIWAIGYQGNNKTTIKILNVSLRESTRTKYIIYIRQWESSIGASRKITVERVLNLFE